MAKWPAPAPTALLPPLCASPFERILQVQTTSGVNPSHWEVCQPWFFTNKIGLIILILWIFSKFIHRLLALAFLINKEEAGFDLGLYLADLRNGVADYTTLHYAEASLAPRLRHGHA